MKTTVQAVVIGGGVVGASVLYHLTKAGWKDVLLLERDELTSGSTWHAAGGFHTLNGDPNVAKLQRYTIELYAELEKISGQSCGLHLTGGLQLADNAERMDFLRLAHAKGRYLGMETEIISASEAKKLLPLIDESKFVGALWDPAEGHLDPSGTTHAYVKAARIQGADVERFCKVEDLQQRLDGTWTVITNKGNIHAEHVVNAGGLWAREVGRMVGLELPVLAMEHMYLLTEDMPEVAEIMAETGKEVVHAIDFKGEIYTRQEGNGMLMGTYEQACRPWSPQNTPWDFGHELLDPDIDRIAPSLEIGFEHFPAFQNAGIKQIINGPFTFSPDGNPLMGPVRGLRNYWCACAVMAGFSQGGGVGLALSNWMVNGDPGFDVWGMDVARFGNWATMGYTNKKVQENYQRRFRIRFPNEELPACRPIQTTPIYDLQLQAGAVMGDSWGLEVPLWYAEKGEKAEDIVSFRRSNDFEPIKRECKAVRDSVGLTEIANFAKYEITGSGAEAWLSHMMTNTMPRMGRIILTPMLNDNGKLIGDFTIAKAAEDQFFMFGSSQAQIYHMRWFEEHLPDDGSVIIRNIDLGLVGLSIAGPNARKVLAKLCVDDVSGETFEFM
ncbi:MAG: FAD-dependent oxidoreductase, partial [Rhizobiales bacterium]|nr:FAD-dependent oxidoreductase [Hyphomicrobiales bacterium]